MLAAYKKSQATSLITRVKVIRVKWYIIRESDLKEKDLLLKIR